MARRASSRRGGRTAEPIRIESGVGVLELQPDRVRPGGRLLLIDGLAHGYVDLDDPAHLELDYVARIGAALEVLVPRGDPAAVLHLGGGAFSLPRFLASTRPGVRQTVAERSGAVIGLAEKHLRLRRGERLRILQADGAEVVEREASNAFDLVLGDAFVGTETPAAMATSAFAAQISRVLRPGGRYLLNVVDQPPWPFAAEQARILLGAFGHALAFGGRDVVRGRHAGNVLFVASEVPLPRDALARRLAGGHHPAEVVPAQRFADRA